MCTKRGPYRWQDGWHTRPLAKAGQGTFRHETNWQVRTERGQIGAMSLRAWKVTKKTNEALQCTVGPQNCQRSRSTSLPDTWPNQSVVMMVHLPSLLDFVPLSATQRAWLVAPANCWSPPTCLDDPGEAHEAGRQSALCTFRGKFQWHQTRVDVLKDACV